jgi:hypothetical protein
MGQIISTHGAHSKDLGYLNRPYLTLQHNFKNYLIFSNQDRINLKSDLEIEYISSRSIRIDFKEMTSVITWQSFFEKLNFFKKFRRL